MSIIIRLQNLPLEANSLDIRRFFQGLHIPDGGVHIVGGENGDAFIAFGTDEDARQAMGRDGNMIKGSHIKLLLSSRNEMQRVIENARTQTLMMGAAGGGAGAGGGQGLPGAQPGGVLNNQTLPPKPGVMPPGSQVPGHYQVPAPSQQQPPQYSQQPPPGAAMNKPPPMYGGPGIPGGGGSGGGQVLPPYASSGGGYPGPGSSVPQQQGPLGGYGMSSHSPSSGPSSKPPQSDPFHDRTRYRSRSRSPPPSRIDSSNSSGATAMHSGLIGSLQQSAYGSGPTNGSAYSSANNSSSGPYDSGNASYSSYQRPYQGPGDQGPPGSKYDARSPGSGPSGWNSNSNNNPSHLMANQAPPSNYPGINNNNNSSSNDYRSGYPPPPNNKDQQHGPYGSGQPLQQQPAYVSNNQMAHSAPPSHQPYSNEPPSMQPPPSSGPPMPPGPGSQSSRMFTLQLSNLPLSVRVDDLLNFFQPLYLHEDNVKIFYDEKGFPTGIALVRFPTPREFETALGYSSKMMSDRQIQIRPLDDMNGPPPSASSQGPLPGGANSASPYPSPAVHQPPPLDPPAYSTNNSYPPAYSSNDNYRQPPPSQQQGSSPYGQQQGPPMHQQQQQQPPSRQQQSQSPPNKELVLFMKGLPYSNCTPHDVAKFFESIVPYNIEIEADSRGKPTGNAFVEFKDRDDYERAMEYNMRHMGRRYIELIPLVGDANSGKYSSGPPSSGHHHHPSGRYGPPPRGGGGGGAPRGDSRGPSSHTYCISVKGLPPDVNSQHLKTFFGEVGARPFAVHVMLTPNQMNAGEAFVEFVEQDEQRCALKRDGDFMGPNRIGVRTVPYEVMMNVIKPQGPPMPPHGGGGGGGGRGDRHGPGDYHRENSSHPKSRGDRPYRGDKERGRGGRRGGGGGGGHGGGGDMGHGGPARSMSPRKGAPPFSDNSCTLLAQNVSFKATDDDLCVFFSDYGIVPERVHRRLNEKGATIEAQISFFTKADTEHALRNMDNKYFLGRNIHLKYA